MDIGNHPHRETRLKELQDTLNLDAFLFTSPPSIKCFSGYFFRFETGSSPFQVLPSVLLMVPLQKKCLVIADNEIPPQIEGLTVIPYESYVYEKQLEFSSHFSNEIRQCLRQFGLKKARVGVEQDTLPFGLGWALASEFPDIEFVDITHEVRFLRVVKDADEIEAIMSAARLCDLGQAAVEKYAQSGMTELELFSKVRIEIEAFAGDRVPMMTDLVSGNRTATGGGNPSNRVIASGDLILSDITPCLNGYWGDSCITTAVGGCSAEQYETFYTIKTALDGAIAKIRPGISGMEIDAEIRKQTGPFPHHGGHGVGTLYHEEPRIVPYNLMILQPGMVIALEPGIYKETWGIRLEHLLVVTTGGCEVLTKTEHHIGKG